MNTMIRAMFNGMLFMSSQKLRPGLMSPLGQQGTSVPVRLDGGGQTVRSGAGRSAG
jgi:hypothetical protein